MPLAIVLAAMGALLGATVLGLVRLRFDERG
jgi:hypothetical protein